jgi:beta-lactamase regulating signal transducer with metallopeptidase domain
MMAILLAVLVDVTIVLTVALVVVAALRRRSAALRHAVLATAVVCALVMPVFELMLPQVPVIPARDESSTSSTGMTLTSMDVVSTTATEESGGTLSDLSWITALAVLWGLGVIVTLGGLLTGLVRLARLKARCAPVTGRWRTLTDELSRECGVTRHVTLLQSTDPSILVTCGVVRPAIILPAGANDWAVERQRIVLRHELGHISRHDAALQLAAEVLRVSQPLNPLVWIACRRLRQESEHACDDAVLAGGVAAAEYATQLLGVAKQLSGRRTAWAAAPAIAHPSTLERRVVAMLDTQKNRQPLTHRGWAVATLVALGVSLPLAAAGVAPEVPAPVVPMLASAPVVTVPTTVPTSVPVTAPPIVPVAPKTTPPVVPQQPAAITGRIVDQTGGVIPGANVTLTDLNTGTQLSAITNATGRFTFSGVPAAQHRLVVSLPGFTSVNTVVTLAAGATLDRTFTLPIGSLAETINVNCSATPFLTSLMQAVFPLVSAQTPSTPIRVGGSIREPKKTKDVKPTCPSGMVAGESTVRLSARIGMDGLVYDVTPIPVEAAAAPPADVTDTGLAAVRQWTFTPTQLNGRPVDVMMTVTIHFTKSS